VAFGPSRCLRHMRAEAKGSQGISSNDTNPVHVVRGIALLACFSVSITLVGCAAAQPGPAAKPARVGRAFTAAVVMQLGRPSHILAPTPTRQSPEIDAAAAYRTALDHTPAGHFSTATEAFGLFTDSNAMSTQDGRSPIPEVSRVPAWVVTFADDCPKGPGGAVQPSPTTAPCTASWYAAVNADTGAFIESFN
jgi:hypothetical protein